MSTMKTFVANKTYISDNARLMAEWDWKENKKNGIDPHKLTIGSGKKANWVCQKGHTWAASIYDRARKFYPDIMIYNPNDQT